LAGISRTLSAMKEITAFIQKMKQKQLLGRL